MMSRHKRDLVVNINNIFGYFIYNEIFVSNFAL